MAVTMPEDIADDPVQSRIWASLAPAGNRFAEQDVPTLRLLCYWHAVARRAQEAAADGDGRVDILDRAGTRQNPALSVLKEATAEIRLLSDQLGVSPRSRASAPAEQQPRSANAKLLTMVLTDREAKARRAAGA